LADRFADKLVDELAAAEAGLAQGRAGLPAS